MSLHPGEKVMTFTGKKATVVDVQGNTIIIARKGYKYPVWEHNLFRGKRYESSMGLKDNDPYWKWNR